MNIFAFDPDPRLSALWLDDVRKNKMILETAQLLSSSVRYLDLGTTLPVYKATHMGHPCTRWARSSRGNFAWLLQYMQHLGEQKLWGHKSMSLVPHFQSYVDTGYFPSEDLEPFVNCARNKDQGIDYKHVADTCEAYRLYICDRWRQDTITLTWNWGKEPYWRN